MRIDFTPRLFMDPQADLKAAQELAETVEVLKDSFKSLGIIIKQQVGDNIQDADRFTKAYGKTLANDITKNLTTMGKRSEDILKNQKRYKFDEDWQAKNRISVPKSEIDKLIADQRKEVQETVPSTNNSMVKNPLKTNIIN
jgi:hypothetical protein